MITVHFIHPDGQRSSLQCKPGISLMQAAVSQSMDGIAADCGGMLSCATCHVMVDEAWADRLPALNADEDSMLAFTAAPRQTRSRLSCQIMLGPELDGLTVHLPSTQY